MGLLGFCLGESVSVDFYGSRRVSMTLEETRHGMTGTGKHLGFCLQELVTVMVGWKRVTAELV